MGDQGISPTSIDSSSHACVSTASLSQSSRGDLRTELKLGLSLSINSQTDSRSSREQLSDRPPTEPLLRSNPDERRIQHHPASFFVKVHMEGIAVGRKLDLFALDGYDSLIRTLHCMFRANISCKHRQNICPTAESQTLMPLRYECGPELAFLTTPFNTGPGIAQVFSRKTYQLIYEDREGDWMMVGDVPWELFLNTVKRLKITKADKC